MSRTRSAGEAIKVAAHRGPQGRAAVAEALNLAGADANLGPDTSKSGFETSSAAGLIRDSGIYRLVDLLKGRAKPRPKRSFWYELFGC